MLAGMDERSRGERPTTATTLTVERTSRSTPERRNPGLWLEDYRLACQAGGADGDAFIIHNLPLYLVDSVRTWLEHLPPNEIKCCADLKEIFMGNF
jgi:hypothetical protein